MVNFSKNSIFRKVFSLLFLTTTIITLIFSLYFLSVQKKEIFESLSHEASGIAKSIIFVNSEALILDEGSFIIEFGTKFIKDNKNIETIILSKLDKSHFLIKQDAWAYNDSLPDAFYELQEKQNIAKIIESPLLKKEVFHFVHPVEFSDFNWGWLHLSINLDYYNNKLESLYLRFFIFLTVLFFVSIFLSYFIAKSIATPIVELNNTAKKISKGDLKLRTEYTSESEIGELASTFNEMMGTIEESQIKLEQMNDKLEDRVNERTKELNKLNETLDKRVKDEISKRQEQENILLQQSRLAAIGEMIGNIAHQWRQPLSLITTAATGISVERELGISKLQEEERRLKEILKSANYLSDTIEDFRNFFRKDKESQQFNIKNQVEHSLELVSASLSASHIEVQREYQEIEDNFGYANEFSQAVLNLLSNAKDALTAKKIQNPKVIVRIFSDENFNILEVEDNALGIDRSIVDKIFDPYFTTKHRAQGTGIGLYMTKMIIEQNMQGFVSTRNGKNGAIFSIKLYKEKKV